jgi:hypothetical protein
LTGTGHAAGRGQAIGIQNYKMRPLGGKKRIVNRVFIVICSLHSSEWKQGPGTNYQYGNLSSHSIKGAKINDEFTDHQLLLRELYCNKNYLFSGAKFLVHIKQLVHRNQDT